jgi:hypothetical protein
MIEVEALSKRRSNPAAPVEHERDVGDASALP